MSCEDVFTHQQSFGQQYRLYGFQHLCRYSLFWEVTMREKKQQVVHVLEQTVCRGLRWLVVLILVLIFAISEA